MKIAGCTRAQAPEILAIYNEAIVNSTALYDYKPRTMATMEAWFAAKEKGLFPDGKSKSRGLGFPCATFHPLGTWNT